MLNWRFLLPGFLLIGMLTACNNQGDGAEQESYPPAGEVVDPGTPPHPGDEVISRRSEEGVSRLVQEYMDVKNAMVNDDYEQVKRAASGMQNSLDDGELSQQERNDLKNSINQLATAQDIKAQRQAFNQLSQQLYQLVQTNDKIDQTLYWQHCPMAMGGQGANWLSEEKQVRNPYMGQRMPGCGSVEETIN